MNADTSSRSIPGDFSQFFHPHVSVSSWISGKKAQQIGLWQVSELLSYSWARIEVLWPIAPFILARRVAGPCPEPKNGTVCVKYELSHEVYGFRILQ